MPGLGKHSFDHALDLVPMSAQAGAHKTLARGRPRTVGCINYYGRYAPSALAPLLRYVNQMLLAWARRKFKRFKVHEIRASQFLQILSRRSARLFVHWRLGMTGTFA